MNKMSVRITFLHEHLMMKKKMFNVEFFWPFKMERITLEYSKFIFFYQTSFFFIEIFLVILVDDDDDGQPTNQQKKKIQKNERISMNSQKTKANKTNE